MRADELLGRYVVRTVPPHRGTEPFKILRAGEYYMRICVQDADGNRLFFPNDDNWQEYDTEAFEELYALHY